MKPLALLALSCAVTPALASLDNVDYTYNSIEEFSAANEKRGLSKVKAIKDAIATANQIQKVKSTKAIASGLVDKLLVKLFTTLKKSGLVNSVVKLSLTDDDARQGVIDLTIQLIEADVVPYEEIFDAVKDSGLGTDIVKNIVTDPETRQGSIDLVIELIPQLLESGAIKLEDIIPKPRFTLQSNATTLI